MIQNKSCLSTLLFFSFEHSLSLYFLSVFGYVFFLGEIGHLWIDKEN